MKKRFVNLRVPAKSNTLEEAEILVEDGLIKAIGRAGALTASGGEEWVDLDNALVLPGVIDGHVHFDDPGFEHRENFATGTRAAAAGGVTCVVDMPCTSIPPVTCAESLEAKLEVISAKAYVDFMLWGGVSANAMEESDWKGRLAGLVEKGVAAVKVYMLSGMESFRDLDHDQLREVLEEAARLEIPVGVHAEDRDLVEESTARVQARGGDGPRDYYASRPEEAELFAVATMSELCRQTRARVHVVHLASGEALDVLVKARGQGLPISAETCPHFLQFTVEDFEKLGAVLKTAPVVKNASDRDRLWQGLADGDLEFVTTDHAPARWPDEKKTGSIWTDYGGVPGVELLLPYLHSEGVCMGRLTYRRLVEITASGPARFFGIDHRKGALAPELDADLVVLDLGETWTVKADELHSLNRYTPLEGRRLTGRVRATYVRGECVYQRGPDGEERFGPPGAGRFVRRGPE